MATKINTLGDADVTLLKEMAEWFRRKVRTSKGGVPESQDQMAPEIYLARTPAGGIPALDEGTTGTGTGTGTGTNNPTSDDIPGAALCDIYRVVNSGTSIIKVFTLKALVFNVCTFAVPEYTWITVYRDKFGTWFVPSNGGVAGTIGEDSNVADHVHVVGVPGTAVGTSTDNPPWYCERVSLSSGWPPVADPTHIYETVYESENREPRIIDTEGGDVTHIIPLFRDRSGNYYIVFWKTDTEITFEYPLSFTITEDPNTCIITATPTMTTKRISLNVAPPSNTDTGLELDIDTV